MSIHSGVCWNIIFFDLLWLNCCLSGGGGGGGGGGFVFCYYCLASHGFIWQDSLRVTGNGVREREEGWQAAKGHWSVSNPGLLQQRHSPCFDPTQPTLKSRLASGEPQGGSPILCLYTKRDQAPIGVGPATKYSSLNLSLGPGSRRGPRSSYSEWDKLFAP